MQKHLKKNNTYNLQLTQFICIFTENKYND